MLEALTIIRGVITWPVPPGERGRYIVAFDRAGDLLTNREETSRQVMLRLEQLQVGYHPLVVVSACGWVNKCGGDKSVSV